MNSFIEVNCTHLFVSWQTLTLTLTVNRPLHVHKGVLKRRIHACNITIVITVTFFSAWSHSVQVCTSLKNDGYKHLVNIVEVICIMYPSMLLAELQFITIHSRTCFKRHLLWATFCLLRHFFLIIVPLIVYEKQTCFERYPAFYDTFLWKCRGVPQSRFYFNQNINLIRTSGIPAYWWYDPSLG